MSEGQRSALGLGWAVTAPGCLWGDPLKGSDNQRIRIGMPWKRVHCASLLVTFWMAIQLAPSLWLIGLPAGEHRLSFHAADRRLVLEHPESVDRHHHLPLERVVIPRMEGADHTDHVVRLPEPDNAARPALPDGLPVTAAFVSSGTAVIPAAFDAVLRTVSREIGPAPPSRSLPLLL
jgi:hypothetical protein